MSDLLDVVHVLFEEDSAPVEREVLAARTRMRRGIYMELYGRKSYDWGSEPEGREERAAPRDAGGTDVATLPAVLSGKRLESKPYIPPTPMDASSGAPFGELLDAPLG
jgi:hypothetical protein